MSIFADSRPWSLIVSRHPAAIEFIRQELPHLVDAEVLASATPDQCRGALVYGNLPLHLAALCRQVTVIEFTGPPPRGQEYSIEDMRAAGAVLKTYHVQAGDAALDDEGPSGPVTFTRAQVAAWARVGIRPPAGAQVEGSQP